MSSDLPELLCRVNFPLYQAMMISPRHLLLGGGGGAAKTGVFNGFVRDSSGTRLFSFIHWNYSRRLWKSATMVSIASPKASKGLTPENMLLWIALVEAMMKKVKPPWLPWAMMPIAKCTGVSWQESYCLQMSLALPVRNFKELSGQSIQQPLPFS